MQNSRPKAGWLLALALALAVGSVTNAWAVFQTYFPGGINTTSITLTGALLQSGLSTFSNLVQFNARTKVSSTTFTVDGTNGQFLVAAGSTLTVNGTYTDNFQYVSSTRAVADTCVGFTGLASSTTYRVTFNLYPSDASRLYVDFNNDHSALYDYACQGVHVGATGSTGGSAQAGGALACDATLPLAANSSFKGNMDFGSVYGSTTQVHYFVSSAYVLPASNDAGAISTSGRYRTATPSLTSVKYCSTTGTLRGWFRLYRANEGSW